MCGSWLLQQEARLLGVNTEHVNHGHVIPNGVLPGIPFVGQGEGSLIPPDAATKAKFNAELKQFRKEAKEKKKHRKPVEKEEITDTLKGYNRPPKKQKAKQGKKGPKGKGKRPRPQPKIVYGESDPHVEPDPYAVWKRSVDVVTAEESAIDVARATVDELYVATHPNSNASIADALAAYDNGTYTIHDLAKHYEHLDVSALNKEEFHAFDKRGCLWWGWKRDERKKQEALAKAKAERKAIRKHKHDTMANYKPYEIFPIDPRREHKGLENTFLIHDLSEADSDWDSPAILRAKGVEEVDLKALIDETTYELAGEPMYGPIRQSAFPNWEDHDVTPAAGPHLTWADQVYGPLPEGEQRETWADEVVVERKPLKPLKKGKYPYPSLFKSRWNANNQQEHEAGPMEIPQHEKGGLSKKIRKDDKGEEVVWIENEVMRPGKLRKGYDRPTFPPNQRGQEPGAPRVAEIVRANPNLVHNVHNLDTTVSQLLGEPQLDPITNWPDPQRPARPATEGETYNDGHPDWPPGWGARYWEAPTTWPEPQPQSDAERLRAFENLGSDVELAPARTLQEWSDMVRWGPPIPPVDYSSAIGVPGAGNPADVNWFSPGFDAVAGLNPPDARGGANAMPWYPPDPAGPDHDVLTGDYNLGHEEGWRAPFTSPYTGADPALNLPNIDTAHFSHSERISRNPPREGTLQASPERRPV
jgi:hypothetical protein